MGNTSLRLVGNEPMNQLPMQSSTKRGTVALLELCIYAGDVK